MIALSPLLFILIFFIAFYIPGIVVLKRFTTLSSVEQWVLSTPVGIVLFGWQGYLFGYLHLRFLTYLYLIIFVLLFVSSIKKINISTTLQKVRSLDLLSVSLIAIGTVGQTFAYYVMGMRTSEGVMLSSRNAPDHIWHVALTNEIVKHFPPFEPGMYEIALKNYHYWFNLVTAEIIRVFHTPLFATHFLGTYILGSIFLGILGYLLMQSFTKNIAAVRWLLFFFYFGSDAIYWLTLITTGKMNFDRLVYLENGTMFMDNPPRAFSVVVALTGIYLLFHMTKKVNNAQLALTALILGTIVGFKVYTGIAVMIGLISFSFYYLYKKDYRYIFLLIGSAFVSALIYFPVNAGSGGLFFLPFDLPRDFISQKELGLIDWALRWQIYTEHHNYFRLFQYGVMMSFVYVVSQFGVKLIGLLPLKTTIKTLGIAKLLFFESAMIVSLVLGIFFYQYSGGSNIFNFFLSASLCMMLVASVNLTIFLEKKSNFFTASVIIVILVVSLPRWILTTADIWKGNYSGVFNGIVNKEIESYEFLEKHTRVDDLVLILNQKHFDSVTPFVTIFSNRNTFLSGQGIIDSHNANNKKRIEIVKNLQKPNAKNALRLLRENKIDYIYFYHANGGILPVGQTVFKNSVATIVKVSK